MTSGNFMIDMDFNEGIEKLIAERERNKEERSDDIRDEKIEQKELNCEKPD